MSYVGGYILTIDPTKLVVGVSYKFFYKENHTWRKISPICGVFLGLSVDNISGTAWAILIQPLPPFSKPTWAGPGHKLPLIPCYIESFVPFIDVDIDPHAELECST